MINVWTIPRESKEWIGPLTVTANGVAVTNYKTAILEEDVRPVSGDWIDPVADGAGLGVMANMLAPGSYKVWIKYSTALEDVVLDDVATVVVT